MSLMISLHLKKIQRDDYSRLEWDGYEIKTTNIALTLRIAFVYCFGISPDCLPFQEHSRKSRVKAVGLEA